MNLDYRQLGRFAEERVSNLVFATVSGAHLYGFPSEDSDIDLRGMFQTPVRDLVGLKRPSETREVEEVVDGQEIEMVAHEASKYLRLLCKNNGYILEQVFSPLIVHGHDFLDRLRPVALRCVTRGCYRHYRGFFQTQRKLLDKQERKKAKTLLYAYRVVLTGIHLLGTGIVESNLLALNRHFGLPFVEDLIARKKSKEFGTLDDLDYSLHRQELDRWEAKLAEAHENSRLPEEAPWHEVNEFLISLRGI